MAVISNRLAIYRLHRLALHNSAVTVDRACTCVANAGDGDTANGEMGCGDGNDLAAVAGRIVQADDVRHGCLSPNYFRPRCLPHHLELLALHRSAISIRPPPLDERHRSVFSAD